MTTAYSVQELDVDFRALSYREQLALRGKMTVKQAGEAASQCSTRPASIASITDDDASSIHSNSISSDNGSIVQGSAPAGGKLYRQHLAARGQAILERIGGLPALTPVGSAVLPETDATAWLKQGMAELRRE